MRRSGTLLVVWLVLAATLQAAFLPLLHDHPHGPAPAALRAADAAQSAPPAAWSDVAASAATEVAAATASGFATAFLPASAPAPADNADADACAVCAHFAGTCFALPACNHAAFAAEPRAPPVARLPSPRPMRSAWLLPASRAPPFLSALIPAVHFAAA